MIKTSTLSSCASLLLFLLTSSYGGGPMYTPVDSFELSKYLGTWYEIARMPAPFEKDLVAVTATYSLKPNGMVNVLNQGHKKTIDGEKSVANGKAKFAGDPSRGHLKVSFFWIFYGDYIIVDLDKDNYQYALVLSPPKYAWILCRKPMLDKIVLERLIEKAKGLGHDTSKLIMVPQ
jgi:apolipoprotein D and lipocalin family protein